MNHVAHIPINQFMAEHGRMRVFQQSTWHGVCRAVVGLGPRPHDFANGYRSSGARLGPIRGVNSALAAFEMGTKISTFDFLPRVNKPYN